MPLKLGSDEEILALVEEIKRPYALRDTQWANRRTVRYRQMTEQLQTLPLNPTIKNTALMVYQTEAPNQEIHKRVKRLIANLPKLEVVIYDDEAAIQRLGQDLEDGLKALLKWMDRGGAGLFHWKTAEHQQGDGLGIGKIDYVSGHGDVLVSYDNDTIGKDDEDEDTEDDDERLKRRARNAARGEYQKARDKYPEADASREEKGYNDATEEALKKELPPFRLTAIDPLSCYWWEDDDGVEIMVETGKKSLNPLLTAFKSYGLILSEDSSRLKVIPGDMQPYGGATAPAERMHKDLSTQVEYTEVRTRFEIAIIINHPKITSKAREAASNESSSSKGVVLRFDNPFAPYTTGYALIAGDVTTEVDPADQYQPPALAALNAAQAQNVLMTAQLSSALEDALAAKYVKTTQEAMPPPSEEDKTPQVKEGREVPMVPGEIKRVETAKVDLARIDQRIAADAAVGGFQEVLEGAASSEATGHRLAIQVSQADIQMVPYQNARARALKELLKGVRYAVRKHGLTIYIPTIPDGPRRGKQLRVAESAKLTPEMADLNFELNVMLGSETPMGKYAKWQALRDREEAGTIGYQTVIEESDVENPLDEIARVFEGKMLKAVMEQAVPMTAEEIMTYIREKLAAYFASQQPPPPEVPPPVELPFQVPPETGLAGGGGPIGPVAGEDMVRVPGINMPAAPQTPEGIPQQMATQVY